MRRAYYNCFLLDGTEKMEPAAHKMVLTDGGKITAIVDETAPCKGYEKIDLHGGYLMPGLINLHVHLAGNGKPSTKPRDNAALAGVGDVTGSIEAGKSADFIVTARNPLDDLTALRHLELVVCRGRMVKHPRPKRKPEIDAALDPYLK